MTISIWASKPNRSGSYLKTKRTEKGRIQNTAKIGKPHPLPSPPIRQSSSTRAPFRSTGLALHTALLRWLWPSQFKICIVRIYPSSNEKGLQKVRRQENLRLRLRRNRKSIDKKRSGHGSAPEGPFIGQDYDPRTLEKQGLPLLQTTPDPILNKPFFRGYDFLRKLLRTLLGTGTKVKPEKENTNRNPKVLRNP